MVLTKRTNLTLEDIFGHPETELSTRDLDKRTFHNPFRMPRPDEITAHRHPPVVTVALVDYRSVPVTVAHVDYQSVPVSVGHTQYNLNIDTTNICSKIHSTAAPSPREHFGNIDCPLHPGEVPSPSGDVYWKRITIGGVPWKGLFVDSHGRQNSRSILGLSLSDSSVHAEMQVVPQFIQKKFKHPIFALHLSHQHGSRLEIGGVDQSIEMEYHKVVKTRVQQQWLIGSCSVYVDDQVVVSNIQTIFSSADGPVSGPMQDMQKILKTIGSNRHAVVYFQWGNGKKWPLVSSWREGSPLLGWLFRTGPWVLGAVFMDGKSIAFNADPDGPEVGIGSRQGNLPEYVPHDPMGPPPYISSDNTVAPHQAPNHNIGPPHNHNQGPPHNHNQGPPHNHNQGPPPPYHTR